MRLLASSTILERSEDVKTTSRIGATQAAKPTYAVCRDGFHSGEARSNIPHGM